MRGVKVVCFHGEKQRKPTWSQFAGISLSKSRKSKAGSRKRARHDQEHKQAGTSKTSNAGLKVGPWQERWSAKSGELAFRLVLNSFCATGRSLCSAARWRHWLPYGRSSVCNSRLSVHFVGLTHGQVQGARLPGLSFSGFCATGRSLCSAARWWHWLPENGIPAAEAALCRPSLQKQHRVAPCRGRGKKNVESLWCCVSGPVSPSSR